MTDENLKYKKRNLFKLIAKVYLVEQRKDCAFFDIVLYKGDKKIHFGCFNDSINEKLKVLRPNDKVVVWFSAKSKLYNEKWYTNLWIQHYEQPNEIHKKRQRELDEIKSAMIDFNNENFDS